MTTLEKVMYELQFLTEEQLLIVYEFMQELKARDARVEELTKANRDEALSGNNK